MSELCVNIIYVKGKKEDVINFGKQIIGFKKEVISLSSILQEKGIVFDPKYKPNKAYKELYEECIEEGLRRLREAKGKECMTFRVIAPMPEVCYIDKQLTVLPDGTIGDAKGAEGWFGWSQANWGTKWDMGHTYLEEYKEELERLSHEEDGAEVNLGIGFSTAYSAPLPFLRTIGMNYQELHFELYTKHETGLFRVHYGVTKSGQIDVIYDAKNELDWMIYNGSSVSEILEELTQGSDDILKSYVNGDADYTFEELAEAFIKMNDNKDYVIEEVEIYFMLDGELSDLSTEEVEFLENLKTAIENVEVKNEQ